MSLVDREGQKAALVDGEGKSVLELALVGRGSEGRVVLELGLVDKEIFGREIPVTGMLGDQQAALFAHNAFQPGVVKATYGTGIFILTSTGSKLFNNKSLVSTIASKTKYGLS